MSGIVRLAISGFVAFLLLTPACAGLPEEWKVMNRPVEPFRIAGNLYYVGASDIASYLLVTERGHILIDGGFEETVPLIRTSIESLGFRLEDVKLLLNSHAHVDHAGGLARLKELTGATLAASRGDAPLLEAGGDLWPFSPVKPDRLFDDGEVLGVGGTDLTAHVTAGHTPGCTTWSARIEGQGKTYDVVFLCSVNVLPGTDLTSADASFPAGRAAAFARSFEVLESLPADIFLGAHASFFSMERKRGEKVVDGANPFVDPDLYRRHIREKKERFEKLLAEQTRP